MQNKIVKITITKENQRISEAINDALRQQPRNLYIYYPDKIKKDLPKYKEMRFFHILFFARLTNIYLVGFPLCIFPKEHVTTFIRFIDTYPGVFLKKCNDCKERNNCFGIPKVYLDNFGDSEFRPYTEKDYCLISDYKNHRENIKKMWNIEKQRQSKIWEYYFKDLKGKILDAGAGIGYFLSFSPERIIGVEKEKTKIESFIVKQEKIDLRHGDIQCLDFDDNYFEGVYSRFVFEHFSLEGAKLALKEMKRVLKLKGKLFIMVGGKDEKEQWYVHHKTQFTRNTLEKLAKKVGFKRYKVFNSVFLEEYKNFNFNCNIQRKSHFLKEIAICLIAEK